MITVSIVCVGGLKEKYWRDACAEYEKRLGAFCRFSIIQVDEERMPDNPSPAQINAALDLEGRKLLSKIDKNACIFAMCIEGKTLSSQALSRQIEQIALDGTSSIVFVIGGSWGLSAEVKSRAKYKLSMSPMTFPHQLARVMLCEQVYRAFQISHGGKYHK